MTKQRELKALVRERMAKTGERYTAARAHLLTANRRPAALADVFASAGVGVGVGLLNGYDRFGGIQGDTGALCNVLRHAGITSTHTGAPYTETMINGLCGGPGFLYAVFEYKGWPPLMSLALRSRSMNDLYISDGLSRLGVRVTTSETTSAGAACKALDSALSAGKAPLCVADVASLPWYGLPSEFVGGAPQVVAIVGRQDEAVWVDDRSTRPIRMDLDELAKARASYRHAKHRLITIEGPNKSQDAPPAMREAIATTARRYVEPAVPKAFWVNCGFSGLEKWRQMLTDTKHSKGWPALFSEGSRAYSGLQRTYECIECISGPHAGRALYADFLDEAAGALREPPLKKAAAAYRDAGLLWEQAAALIANCDDAAIRQACEIADRRFELADTHGAGISKESRELWQKRHTLGADCRLSQAGARALYANLADIAGRILESERAAVALMS